MKNLLILLFAVLFPMAATAQNQKELEKILDAATSKLLKDSGVVVDYTVTAGGQDTNGQIKMKGKKFVNEIGGHVVWFDGRTMWTLVKENEEVNVTTPTAKELAKMNPYAFASLYKKGYTLTKGQSTHAYHSVVLRSSGSGNAVKSMEVHINRMSKTLQYAKMQTADGTMEVRVRSYKGGQRFADSTFVFNAKHHPNVEVIDLR